MCKAPENMPASQDATKMELSAVRDVLSELQCRQEESADDASAGATFELQSPRCGGDLMRFVSQDRSTVPTAFTDLTPPAASTPLTAADSPPRSPRRIASNPADTTAATTPVQSALTSPRGNTLLSPYRTAAATPTPPRSPRPDDSLPPLNSWHSEDTAAKPRKSNLPVLEDALRAEFEDESGPYADLPKFLRPAIASLQARVVSAARSGNPKDGSAPAVQEDFECVNEPTVPLQAYAALLFQSFKQVSHWATALVLLRKFTRKSGVLLTTLTVHRVLLTSLVATARRSGWPCDADATWGVDESDLEAMEAAFAAGIAGDYPATYPNQVRELVPFHNTPQYATMAAYLLSPDMSPVPSRRRVARWVHNLPPPPPAQNKLKKALDLLWRKTGDIKSFIRPVHDDITCVSD